MKIIAAIKHTYNAVLNKRSIPGLILNFFINFFPVLLWLILFKNASLIPIEWRPTIHVKWLPLADDYCFNVEKLTSFLFYLLTSLFLISPICLILLELRKYINLNHFTKNSNYYLLQDSTASSSSSNNYTQKTHKTKLAIYFMLILAWPLLNILNYLAHLTQNYSLDLLSFISYVLLHLIVPIVTSVYLYVFQFPGVLSCYSWTLGTQNILGLSTHILLPSSPPWFVHLNGINATADYSTLGYAAGLIRVDSSLGTHLTTNGFHKSPIVFGALPSLHSAMAVLSFLYISWFTSSLFLSLLAFSFVLLQWWSTIYLDHHWRLDLFMGMCYAIVCFSIYKFTNPKIFKAHENYINHTSTNINNNNNTINHFSNDANSTDTLLDDLELQCFSDDINPNSDFKNNKYLDCELNLSNSSSSSLTITNSDHESEDDSYYINNHNSNDPQDLPDNRPFGLRLFAGTPLEFIFS